MVEKVEEEETVRMSCCELGVGGWEEKRNEKVGGWEEDVPMRLTLSVMVSPLRFLITSM